MTNAWIKGAKVIEAVDNGGTMTGEDHYATWHSTENDPYTTTAATIAHYLNQTRNCVHVVWNPVSGEIVVTMPPDVAGRGLENPAGGVETNRNGKINIQVEVVARASKPFTDYPMVGREAVLEALDAHGVPRKFSVGKPLPYPQSYGANGQRRASQAGSGHVTHSQWNENVHGDPGAIDPDALLSGHTTHVDPAPPNHKPQFHRENGDGLYERGEQGPGIETLQRQLKTKGFYDGQINGRFDADTERAVKAFQRHEGLDVDGVAGPRTLHALGQRHIDPHGPGLKVDGVMGNRTMRALQRAVGLTGKDVDGWFKKTGPYSYNFGKHTEAALRRHLQIGYKTDLEEALQRHLDVRADGAIGHDTIVALQKALNASRF